MPRAEQEARENIVREMEEGGGGVCNKTLWQIVLSFFSADDYVCPPPPPPPPPSISFAPVAMTSGQRGNAGRKLGAVEEERSLSIFVHFRIFSFLFSGVPVDQLVPSRAQESNTAQLLQAALQEEQEDLRFSRPGARPQGSNEALESLFATAAVSVCSMSYSMLKLKKRI